MPPKRPISVLSLALALALSAIRAGATVRTVPTPDYPTIQSAIDASSSGDTVAVYSGVYAESLSLSGKDWRSWEGPLTTLRS